MATRYHLNPKTGKPGICNPVVTGVCKYGESVEHFDSFNDAQTAFEGSMTDQTFSVVFSRGNDDRKVETFDEKLDTRIGVAEGEFAVVEDKNEWIAVKVEAVVASQKALTQTLPGSPDRKAALANRIAAREALLAADLVAWRSSEFHSPATEERMKAAAIAVSDADSSIEAALADNELSAVASTYGISRRDAENILEVVHEDYLRPRQGLSSSIGDLSANDSYATTTAYVFRVEPAAVKGVLNYAANYSKVASTKTETDFFALLND